MLKKLSVVLSVLLILVVTLGGCTQNTETSSEPKENTSSKTSNEIASETTEKDNKIVIGFSQCTLDSPFYVALMDAAKVTANDNNVEFIYVDAQNDIIKQNNDVMDLLSKGIDALILNPVDPEGVNPILEACEKQNVPVITVDRPVVGNVATFVGRLNDEMGKLMGEKAVEILGGAGNAKGKILEIQGAAGCNVMKARRDGFHSVVDKEKGIEVVQSPYSDYVRSKAIKATQDIIQAHPDINVVYAHNDDMALGALQVLEQNGITDVKVVAVDGLMEAVQAIRDGDGYVATTINDPGYLGKLAVEAAIDVINGKDVPEFIDGKTGVIDKSNAADYFDDSKVFAEFK